MMIRPIEAEDNLAKRLIIDANAKLAEMKEEEIECTLTDVLLAQLIVCLKDEEN